jgi:DNA-binding NtrC family response regulator
VRVVSATNLAKESLQDEQSFRQDLLFRLNTVEINLPPLRQRSEDIPLLADHFVDYYAKKYQQTNPSNKKLTAEALAAISAYAWPGNIRELRHAIERAMILSQSDMLVAADFQLESGNHSNANQPAQSAIATPSITQANSATELTMPEALNLEQIEKNAINLALKKHRFNISHTAKELGLTRAALYRRMEKHGL